MVAVMGTAVAMDTATVTAVVMAATDAETPGRREGWDVPTPPVGPKVLLAGDSTATSMDHVTAPMDGWGASLGSFLPAGVRVRNGAFSGATAQQAIECGTWGWLLDEAAAGDVVVIQFGHNDQKTEHPDGIDRYRERLAAMVEQVRARGAVPVLATSIACRRFEEQEPVPTHGRYPETVRSLAATTGCALLDLERFTTDLLRAFGPSDSARLLTHIDPGEHVNYPDGVHDDSHLSFLGADMIAQEVARWLVEAGLIPVEPPAPPTDPPARPPTP
jgi:lysophospholipase L1-like esterase